MKLVTVLMSTYNGEKFLLEQIESIIRQRDVKTRLYVRDDGSTDGTVGILDEYQNNGVLKWYGGENLKSAKSFLDLVNKAPESDYYAFCDQDDVWKDDKLARAVELLSKQDPDTPLLYCADYQLVDEDLKLLPDNGHVSTTSFGAALVASNATGCTLVFNKRLKDILKLYTPTKIVMHDDWVHKVCLAVEGIVVYDKGYKALLYRQHGKNVDGGQRTVAKRISLIKQRILSGERIRSKQISEIITGYSEMMPKDNIKLAKQVAEYNKSLFSRFGVIFSRKIKTPYKKQNAGFRVAIMLGYF